MKKQLLTAVLAFACLVSVSAQGPNGTYLYAERDTCRLFFDVYEPAPEADTTLEGHEKPTLLFVYGGGFIGGYRSNERYMPWFKILNDNGYRVITIDYRLGLKGVKMDFSIKGRIQTAKNTIKAEYMVGYEAEAVPDLVEAICAITTGVMSVSAGVISESADGVSISYSQSASSIAAGLTAAQKSALESYKVVSSHGA